MEGLEEDLGGAVAQLAGVKSLLFVPAVEPGDTMVKGRFLQAWKGVRPALAQILSHPLCLGGFHRAAGLSAVREGLRDAVVALVRRVEVEVGPHC